MSKPHRIIAQRLVPEIKNSPTLQKVLSETEIESPPQHFILHEN